MNSTSWKEHIGHLRVITKRLRETGLKAKSSKKCQYGQSECIHLGHVVGNGHVRPEPTKVESVYLSVPKTKKHIQPFLRLKGYYRRLTGLCYYRPTADRSQ